MADFFGAATDLIGGIGGYMGAQAEAKGYTQAAQTYAQAARLTQASTHIKEAMVSRQIYQTMGGMRAEAGGSGLKQSGNILDLIRDSAHQGAIAKAVVDIQGEIDYTSLMAQSASETAKATAAKTKGTTDLISGIVGSIGKIFFSDDTLKEDVTLVHRRPDGIGVYRWRYSGSAQFFEGAMASDVEKVRPDAIFYDDDLGLRMVDYTAIRMELKYAPHP